MLPILLTGFLDGFFKRSSLVKGKVSFQLKRNDVIDPVLDNLHDIPFPVYKKILRPTHIGLNQKCNPGQGRRSRQHVCHA
jgi:hypothetical protein